MSFEVEPIVIFSSPEARLQNWKELRQRLAELDDQSAMELVADYWSKVPLSAFSYNPETPEEWLTPWEMVHKGDWCPLMLAVAMEMTLRLSGWDSSRMELVYFRDYDISEEVFVLKIDGKFALNYSVGKVVEFPKTKQVLLGSWQFQGRSYRAITN